MGSNPIWEQEKANFIMDVMMQMKASDNFLNSIKSPSSGEAVSMIATKPNG